MDFQSFLDEDTKVDDANEEQIIDGEWEEEAPDLYADIYDIWKEMGARDKETQANFQEVFKRLDQLTAVIEKLVLNKKKTYHPSAPVEVAVKKESPWIEQVRALMSTLSDSSFTMSVV